VRFVQFSKVDYNVIHFTALIKSNLDPKSTRSVQEDNIVQGIMLGFSIGAIATAFLFEYASYSNLLLILAIALRFIRPQRVSLIRFLLAFVCGVYWISVQIMLSHQAVAALPLNNQPVTIDARIVSAYVTADNRSRIDINLFSVNGDALDGRLRLSCFSCNLNFEPGQRWNLLARLKPIHGLSNPGGFDYEKWAFSQNILARGSIVKSAQNRLVDQSNLQRIRWNIFTYLGTQLSNSSSKGIIQAITVGIKQNITDKQWELFSSTGTGHLIAISGLHVSLVFGFFVLFFSLLLRVYPPLLLRIPARKFGVYAAIIPTFGYALLTGLSMPTLRALVMIGVFILAYHCKVRVRLGYSLLLALTTILIIDPFSPLTAGFWFSFLAVASILVWIRLERSRYEVNKQQANGKSPILVRGVELIYKTFRLQLCISLVVIPVSFIFFGSAPLLSPGVNLVAVPYFSIFVLPISLLGIGIWLVNYESTAHYFINFSAFAMQQLEQLLIALSQFDFSANPVSAEFYIVISVLMASVLLFFYRRFKTLIIVVISGLIMIAGHSLLQLNAKKLKQGEFITDVLDVGQGLSVVIRTRTSTLLFDAGIRYSNRYDMGKIVILPWMAHNNIKKISQVVISHSDRDHVGGWNSINKNLAVGNVLSSDHTVANHVQACHTAPDWTVDGVTFSLLWPDRKTLGTSNDDSCVLRVSSEFGSVLIPGDIEATVESTLASSLGEQLDVDLLIVAHHGSKTSSSAIFLSQAKPKLAVISRGFMNAYNHPHADVLARFKNLGIKTEDTALSGAVTVTFSENGLQTSKWRQDPPNYWSTTAK